MPLSLPSFSSPFPEPTHSQGMSGNEDSASTDSPPTGFPTFPPPTYTQSAQSREYALMEFFGQRAPPPPRHTSTRGRYSSAPPPYESESRENDTSPTYTSASDAEPTTLAKYMFRYGFLFPPFWIMGVIILGSPLRPTPEWEVGKGEEEKKRQLERMRKAEVKWGLRCLGAFTVLLLAVGLVIVGVIFSRRR